MRKGNSVTNSNRTYEFTVIFSGLCLHHLPDDDSGQPQVFVVNAGKPRTSIDGKTHLHPHQAVFGFNPKEVDDFSVDLESLKPKFHFVTDGRGDQVAVVDLCEQTIELELDDEDKEKNHFTVETPKKKCGEYPVEKKKKGKQGKAKKEEKYICWLASLQKVDRRILSLRPQCYEDLVGNRLVTARMPLKYGHLAVHRVGKRDTGNDGPKYRIWNFRPNPYPQDGQPVQQALADQICLTLKLNHPIRIKFDGPTSGELVFPRSLDVDPVVSISNLPLTLDLPDTDVLTHFRWFYELVEWEGGGLPSDLGAPLPAGQGVRVVGGGGPFCPSGSCP